MNYVCSKKGNCYIYVGTQLQDDEEGLQALADLMDFGIDNGSLVCANHLIDPLVDGNED